MLSSDQLKFALLNIRTLSSKCFYISDFISHYGLDFLLLTECVVSSTASETFPEASPKKYSI